MTCAERRDLLLLYAAGTLEPAEQAELRAHLATGCPVCAGALAEAEALVAQVANAIAPVAPPAGALDKLMARVAAPASPRSIRPAPRRPLLAPLLAAAAAVAVTSAAFLFATRDARRLWTSGDVATIALASPTQPSAKGQVLWDREHASWRLTVAKLATPQAGREYELWFIPKGCSPIRAKTFGVGQDGRAMLVVDVPASVGPGAVAAITDEPLGGTDAPTGKIHLAGTFD